MIAKEILYGKIQSASLYVLVFVLSLTFFMKILINQEYTLLSVDRMYVVKIVCQASLPLFLT